MFRRREKKSKVWSMVFAMKMLAAKAEVAAATVAGMLATILVLLVVSPPFTLYRPSAIILKLIFLVNQKKLSNYNRVITPSNISSKVVRKISCWFIFLLVYNNNVLLLLLYSKVINVSQSNDNLLQDWYFISILGLKSAAVQVQKLTRQNSRA